MFLEQIKYQDIVENPSSKEAVIVTRREIDRLLEEDSWSNIYLDTVGSNLKEKFGNLSNRFPLSSQSIVFKGSFSIRKISNSLFVDRIEAPGSGKPIMFYIIACALYHDLKYISLKAEPIGPEKERKSLEDLIGFYGSFGFKRGTYGANGVTMKLDITDENGKVLLMKLFHFLQKDGNQ